MSVLELTSSHSLGENDESTPKFFFKPMNSGIGFDMGDRTNDVEIHNKSSLYLLGDIKPNEISILKRDKQNRSVSKRIIQEGTKYQLIELSVANNALAVNTQFDGNSDICWITNSSTTQTHQFELIPPTKMNQRLLVYHNYTGVNTDANSNYRINFGVVARCVEGVFEYTSSTAGTAGGSKIVNTQTSIITGNNKYVKLQNKRSISFIGMKNPSTDALFWIVEDNGSKILN